LIKVNERRFKSLMRVLSRLTAHYVSMVLVLSLLSCSLAGTPSQPGISVGTESSEYIDVSFPEELSHSPSPSPLPDLKAEAVIMASGDIILHDSVIKGGEQSGGGYDYEHIFEFVKDIFTAADFSMINFEGTTAGPGYSGYPRFNAPDEIAKAILDAGIDAVNTANNHAYDKGIEGVRRTADVFRETGLIVVGTRSDASDPGYFISDLNGIKVGFTGYTYETHGNGAGRYINGIYLPEEAWPLVDSFNYYSSTRLAEDKKAMRARISEMKKAGAEVIVFNMHWGEEYKTSHNSRQSDLARFLALEGVDIIFGHHPHVLQEIEVITAESRSRNTIVFYSLGNIMGNMGFNTHSTNGYAEDAVIAEVKIERDSSGNISVTEGRFFKTYIWKDDRSGKRIHRILPVKAAVEDPQYFGADENVQRLAAASAIRTDNVLSGSLTDEGPVRISERY